MRPITKGEWPTYGKEKDKKYLFNDWKRAIKHLKERTGDYCHLCEMRVNNCLAIEHIESRDGHIELESDWDNFLLACTSCNSNKKAKPLTAPYREHYYWPHLNNTLLAFFSPVDGSDACLVRPQDELSAEQLKRAKATIELYELDKRVTSSGDSDNRFIERMKATKTAIDLFLKYEESQASISKIVDMAKTTDSSSIGLSILEHGKIQKQAAISTIVNFAKTTGFFSIWLYIFDKNPEVKKALLNTPEFHIDLANWVDENMKPKPRNPTLPDPI